MKKTLFTVFFISALGLLAQTEKYYKSMGETIAQLYQVTSPTEYDPLINVFTRIGEAEKNQWEPHYYTALGYTFKSLKINDLNEKDKLLNQALEALTIADAVSINNPEIIALQGFVYMIKIGVDPATRGQQLTGKTMGLFGKAMALDPQNPRATLFMAQMQIGTARFFGTKIDEPCALVNRSVTLFDAFKPSNPIAPMWGRESANEYVKMCGNSTEQ